MRPALWLVRHGQAGHDPAHYDQLSDLGAEQSRRLAAHWRGHGLRFGQAYSGTLVRQRRTLATILDEHATAGWQTPPVETLPALDEYRFADLLRALDQVEPGHPALVAARADPANRRLWIPMLRAALEAWMDGRLDARVAEEHAAFAARVQSLQDTFRARASREAPLLAVSSGGVIATFTQQVLGAPPTAAIDLNLALRNTGQVSFGLDDAGCWRLLGYNELNHLALPQDRALWTLV